MYLPLWPYRYQKLLQVSNQRVGLDVVVQSNPKIKDASIVTSAEPVTGRQ